VGQIKGVEVVRAPFYIIPGRVNKFQENSLSLLLYLLLCNIFKYIYIYPASDALGLHQDVGNANFGS